jgi:alpha-beta hydrolase superfamily lysophospholipase
MSGTSESFKYEYKSKELKNLIPEKGFHSRISIHRVPEDVKAIATQVTFIGMGCSQEDREDMIRDTLAAGRNIILVEWPGQGASSRFLNGKDEWKKQYVRDFNIYYKCAKEIQEADFFKAERELAHSQGQKFVLYGHSMGGEIAGYITTEDLTSELLYDKIILDNPMVSIKVGHSGFHRLGGYSIAHAVCLLGFGKRFARGEGQTDPAEIAKKRADAARAQARKKFHIRRPKYHSDAERYDNWWKVLKKFPERAVWGVTWRWYSRANFAIKQLWDAAVVRRQSGPEYVTPRLILVSKNDRRVVRRMMYEISHWLGMNDWQRRGIDHVVGVRNSEHDPYFDKPAARKYRQQVINDFIQGTLAAAKPMPMWHSKLLLRSWRPNLRYA